MPDYHSPDSIFKDSFDGLAKFSEQGNIENAINGRDVNDFANYPVAVAIFAGLEKNPNKIPSDDKYRDYYDIYSNDYNHDFIRYFDETIGYLLSLVNRFLGFW